MDKKFLQATLTKSEGDSFEFVASTEHVDRVGESLPLDAWDLKNFKKAPRLMVDHEHRVDKIVGRADKIQVKDGALRFRAVFHEITELSRQVKEMVAQGFLNTVSVGFIPSEEKNELIEISLVTVPANPHAQLIKGLMEEKSVDVDVNKIKEFVENEEEENEGEQGEVTEEEITEVEEVAEIKVLHITDEFVREAGIDIADYVDEQEVDEVGMSKDIFLELVGAWKKQQDTSEESKGKTNEGRSVSKKEQEAIIAQRTLRDAVKLVNQGLFEINRIKE